MEPAEIRRLLRQQRQQLTEQDHRQAADNAARLWQQHPLTENFLRLAVYLPNDAEISPNQIVSQMRSRSARIYLPILDIAKEGSLIFGEWHEETVFDKNRFGIAEPVTSEPVSAHELDAILMPLVGFDKDGNRLGMGGGFYDRTLAGRERGKRPCLIGLAHDCQMYHPLPNQPWDVPLDAVLTGSQWYLFTDLQRLSF